MKNILVPIDFSQPSLNALDYAIELAKLRGSRVYILNSVNLPPSTTGMLISAFKKIKEEVSSEMDEVLEKLNADHSGEVQFKKAVLEGPTVEMIKEFATEINADLIVMGTTGAGGMEEVLLGSNTANLIPKANCPVLAIPRNARFSPIQKIVYAREWKDGDGDTLVQLIGFAKVFDAAIDVVHFVPEGERTPKPSTDLFAAINYDRLAVKFLNGDDIIEGIQSYLFDSKAGMIAMMTRKRSFFEKLFRRSLTKQVAMHTETPLLAFQE